ncbi:MAG TPA: FAD:protein FMN transferase [Vicinamibacteria bacterium]|nr:FAD:protein FMN transferase [Vicinamibacteria bacterium]
MACRFEITLHGTDARHIPAAREALDAIDAIEDALSIFRAESEVVEVNRRAAERDVPLGSHVWAVLHRAHEIYSSTERAFDATSTPLSRIWGFFRREGRLPAAGEIEAARALVGMDNVRLDEATRSVRFRKPGVELNFNAIGKGYALDRVAAGLRRRGVRHALLSAGGSSVLAVGGGREGFSVDVRSARVARPLARLRLSDAALGTSGAGEQYFELDGRRFGHLLDPRTGWPASGLLSVSVVADEAATADALATAFFIGGAPLAERYCAEHPRTLVLITEEGDPETLRVIGDHDGVRWSSAGHAGRPAVEETFA